MHVYFIQVTQDSTRTIAPWDDGTWRAKNTGYSSGKELKDGRNRLSGQNMPLTLTEPGPLAGSSEFQRYWRGLHNFPYEEAASAQSEKKLGKLCKRKRNVRELPRATSQVSAGRDVAASWMPLRAAGVDAVVDPQHGHVLTRSRRDWRRRQEATRVQSASRA